MSGKEIYFSILIEHLNWEHVSVILVSPNDELGQDCRAAATMTTCSPLNRT